MDLIEYLEFRRLDLSRQLLLFHAAEHRFSNATNCSLRDIELTVFIVQAEIQILALKIIF